jgi:hypothetical protein
VSSLFSKSSSCTRFWGRDWYLTSSRIFSIVRWLLPLRWTKTSQVLNLWLWVARWWRCDPWLFAPLDLRQWEPQWLWFVNQLRSWSPEPVTKSPFAQVIMTQSISYAECHEKVVKSFEAKPPELAALELGPKGAAQVCSRRNGRLVVKCHGGTINHKLLVPCRRLPSKKVLRWHMVHPRSCSLHPLHGDTSSGLRFIAPTSFGHCFGVSGGVLWSTWGKDVEALLSCVRCRE